VGENVVTTISSAQVAEQAGALADTAAACVDAGDIAPYYDQLRRSVLPFIPALVGDPTAACVLACNALIRIGAVSPGAAYALENHLFIMGGFANHLATATEPTDERSAVEAFHRRVLEERALVANSGPAVHAKEAQAIGNWAEARDGGGYTLSGRALFVSISRFADYLVHRAPIRAADGSAGAQGFFTIPLRDNPRVAFGELTLPRIMVESETRPITFADTPLAADQVLFVAGHAHPVYFHQTYLHFLFHGAQFLGAAAGAVEAAFRFAAELQTPSGPLSDGDGFRLDFGRVLTRLRACEATLFSAAQALRLLRPAAGGGTQRGILELQSYAQSANAFVTAEAEQIVGWARQLVGTRSFTSHERTSTLERLSKDVWMAPLSPVPNNMLHRIVGRGAAQMGFRAANVQLMQLGDEPDGRELS
jgi:alkylation response protein AidB-like acyl-CoA dehydrogenase